MPQSHIVRQVDFSGGELDSTAKRRDDTAQVRAGARQLSNWRLRAAGGPTPRPGRQALFPSSARRTETIRLPGDLTFSLTFGAGTLTIRDAGNVIVAAQGGYPWSLSSVARISFAVVNRDVLMCFPGMKPKIARRSSAGAWSFFDFAFDTGYQNELRAPFYRFPETRGITLTPSARSGAITLTASAAVFQPGHVGTVFRYKGCQMTVTAVTSGTVASATVLQQLPPAQTLTVASTDGFFVGQVVTGNTSGATGEVTAVGAGTVTIQLKSIYTGFAAETIVSPTSRTTVSAVAAAALQPSVEWDEIAVSDYRGWPAACLFDRSRITFMDLPQIPEGIVWSAIASYGDFYVGSDADKAIFELVPGRARVLAMSGGPDQFVFTDQGVFFVPISDSSPLAPGSVQFVRITSDGAGAVAPVATSEGILYANAALTRVIAIVQTGQQTRPYIAQDTTELCAHLVKQPICLASLAGDLGFPERYAILVNADGTVAVGRFADSGTGKRWVGWVPWSGAGLVRWVSSLAERTLFSVDYVGAATVSLVELLDDSEDMDGVFALNAVPAQLAGAAPLWMWAGLTIDLVDNGRDLGMRQVDATGHVVKVQGDDFSAATIRVGQAFRAVLEPFVPHVAEGQDLGQTMRRRKLKRAAVTVAHSTGFQWGNRSIPAVAWGEEGGVSPVPREETYRFRSLGSSFDPRDALIVDRPGSIDILEVGLEVTV